MTITSTVTRVEIAAGNVTADTYTFNLPIHKAADLEVYVDGTNTAPNDNVNPYSVTVAANKQSAEIAFTNTGASAPHRGKALIFSRIVEFKQETDLANNSLFDAESLETTLDNIVMQTMQIGNAVLSDTHSTAFSFDISLGEGNTMYNDTPSVASTLSENLAARANKALAFDNVGDITITATDIDEAIDYQLEAKEWASLVSGNVYSYTDGSRDADQGSISAKAQATAAAASAASAATSLAEFNGIYHGASLTTPTSNVTDGDLWFDTNSGQDVMKVYDVTSTSWVAIAPNATNQAAILAVNTDPFKTNIGLVAAIDDKVEDVAAIDTEIGQLAVLGTAGAHISTVAAITTGDISKVANITTGDVSKVAVITTGDVSKVANITTGDVSKVADIDDQVEDVADIDTQITTLIDGTDGTSGTGGTTKNILLVDGVHDKITEVGNLGTSTVVGYMTALNASGVINNMAALNASGVIADIGTVADMDGEVNSFANRYRVANSAPQSSLDQGDLYFNTANNTLYTYGTAWQSTAPNATDQANINIVAGELTYAEDLGLITTTPTTSSGNDIDTVAGLETEIGLVAAVDGEIALLGTANMTHPSTGHLALLGTADMANTTDGYLRILGNATVTADMAILGSTTVTDDMALLAIPSVITNIGTVAGMVAEVNRYATEYIISSSEPSSPAPTEGDLWYDSTNNVLKFHNGNNFAAIAAETFTELSDDTTPTLGGNLDADDNDITNMGNIDGTNLNIDFGTI